MSNNLDFEQILEKVQRTKQSIITFPYVATDYLGVSRRGWRITQQIYDLFEKYDVICEPEFASAWFYGQIEIKPKPKVAAGKSNVSEEIETDPTPRLSLLTAANLEQAKEKGEGRGLISVKRDTPISEAITLMLLHDYSQLPILSGSRQVEGIISWKSIGRTISLRKDCKIVSDCKEEVEVLSYDSLLFEAVKIVLKKEVVLVKQKDGTISGIVTATDIGEQFISMAEPFLIMEQIENHLRKLLDQKFDTDELKSSSPAVLKVKEIKSLSDLSFGDYVRIFEDPRKFDKIGLNLDRVLFAKQLEEVREIRNDVMHFDPEGITPKSLDLLRETVTFLHTISATMKTKK